LEGGASPDAEDAKVTQKTQKEDKKAAFKNVVLKIFALKFIAAHALFY
jgi:hypothetical protein